MEPPRKRPRTSSCLGFDALDTDQDFLKARSQNDSRLKSTFESIFEKYSKDFSTVGDEIDLETGEIVINNGHLRKMRDEQDAGKLLSMLMAAPGDYDDLGQYEAEEIERKAIIAIPELEDFFAYSHTKEITDGDLGSLSNDLSSALGSRPHGTNTNERSKNASQTDLPSSADILRQFGLTLGPRIVQYVAQLQTGNNSKVDPIWRAPALPHAPFEKEATTQPIREHPAEVRAVSPTCRSLWASETAQAPAKKNYSRSAAGPIRNLPKSTESLPSENERLVPPTQALNTVPIYSPNTRRKLKGDCDSTPPDVETKADPPAQAPIKRKKLAPLQQTEQNVLRKAATDNENPAANMKLRRSARLSSAPDLVLDVQFAKSPMKTAFLANIHGSRCETKEDAPLDTPKDHTPRKSERQRRSTYKQEMASVVVRTPSQKNKQATEGGQSTPVSSLLKPRNRKKQVSVSPSKGRSRGHAEMGNIPGSNDREKNAAPSVHNSAGTPALKTFNNTPRKCGEKGFRCSKDFCLKCL